MTNQSGQNDNGAAAEDAASEPEATENIATEQAVKEEHLYLSFSKSSRLYRTPNIAYNHTIIGLFSNGRCDAF